LWFEASPGKYPKTTKQNGDVAPVVEHLLCKREALSSNPNPSKKPSQTKHAQIPVPQKKKKKKNQ
jgi:hypothetical protein